MYNRVRRSEEGRRFLWIALFLNRWYEWKKKKKKAAAIIPRLIIQAYCYLHSLWHHSSSGSLPELFFFFCTLEKTKQKLNTACEFFIIKCQHQNERWELNTSSDFGFTAPFSIGKTGELKKKKSELIFIASPLGAKQRAVVQNDTFSLFISHSALQVELLTAASLMWARNKNASL